MPTLTNDEIAAALKTLIGSGLTFGEVVAAFAAAETDPNNLIRAEWARNNANQEGASEIDNPTIVSYGEDPGAYVMAWVWVSDKDIWQGPTDSDDEPCRFVNHYHCEDCNESWTDQWSCACNDRCPGCNKEIEPEHTDELDLEGNVIPETADAG